MSGNKPQKISYRNTMGTDLNKSTIGVPRKIIKLPSSYIRECLTFIFNQSLQQGIVPGIFKISKVKPIDKEGEITDPKNFCPISTLSTFTQLFEKLIHKQLINYVENSTKKSSFNFKSFGFSKGHSTVETITEITNTLRKAIDNNLYTCGVFLDFSRVEKIIGSLWATPLNCFQSYLSNRKQSG